MELDKLIDEIEDRIFNSTCEECSDFYKIILDHLIDYRKLVS